MHIVRTILRALSVMLFRPLVFVLPGLAALAILLSGGGTLQDGLKQGGVYDNVVPAALDKLNDEAAKKSDRPENADADIFTNKDIQRLAEQSISPEVVEGATTEFTDSVFAWLGGESEQLEFRIDLNEPVQQFITNLKTYVTERTASLPTCSPEQIRNLAAQQEKLNPLTAPCVPAGTNAQQAAAELEQDLLENAEFFSNPVLTQDDLPKNDEGQRLDQQQINAPAAYQAFQVLPWILGAATLLLGAVAVLLHTKRRRGIQVVARTLIGTGAFLFIFAGIFLFLASNVEKPVAKGGLSPDLERAVGQAMSYGVSQFAKIVGLFAVVYLVIGIVMLVIEHKTREPITVRPPEVPEEKHVTELPAVEPEEPKAATDKKKSNKTDK